MKKILRNSLILALGLTTTGLFAQDWNVDSRTRIDMSGDDDKFSTEQRATIGATWGDSDWGIHVSSDMNYTLGDPSDGSNGGTNNLMMGVYEAYASTNLFGYANLTIGRQALDYGSGALIGSNQWADGGDRNTWDGMTFSFDNDLLNVDLGLARANAGTDPENSGNKMWANASKDGDNWGINLLYASDAGVSGGVDNDKETMMGADMSYTMGAFNLGVSYNTNSSDAAGTEDGKMTSVSAGYAVNDDLSISASRTAWGEDAAFRSIMGNNMDGSYDEVGGMGQLDANDVSMSMGVNYNMGAISLGLNYTNVTNKNTGLEDYKRTAMDLSLGYDLNDNANLGLRYVTDKVDGVDDADKYMWVTLTVTP